MRLVMCGIKPVLATWLIRSESKFLMYMREAEIQKADFHKSAFSLLAQNVTLSGPDGFRTRDRSPRLDNNHNHSTAAYIMYTGISFALHHYIPQRSPQIGDKTSITAIPHNLLRAILSA
jgi:hypothetical protein